MLCLSCKVLLLLRTCCWLVPQNTSVARAAARSDLRSAEYKPHSLLEAFDDLVVVDGVRDHHMLSEDSGEKVDLVAALLWHRCIKLSPQREVEGVKVWAVSWAGALMSGSAPAKAIATEKRTCASCRRSCADPEGLWHHPACGEPPC